MRTLLDTDIFIEVFRRRDTAILAKWDDSGESDRVLLCSPVTVAEVWHGAKPAETLVLEHLFEGLVCVPVTQEIGRQAGSFLAQYSKSHNLQLGDALIAATALIHGAALWTRNRKHYPMKSIQFY